MAKGRRTHVRLCPRQLPTGPGGRGANAAYHAEMGFNPFRPQRKTIFDVLMVIGALAAAAAVVVWALASS